MGKLIVLSSFIIFFFLLVGGIFPTDAQTIYEPGPLYRVEVQVPYYNYVIGSPAINVSALGYDYMYQPIWSGVTYEWGVSSLDGNASVGTVYGNISNIVGNKPGTAAIWVIARQGDISVKKSFQITIQPKPACVPLGDVDCNRSINIIDLSRLLSKFGQSTYESEDVDQNGIVNIIDLSILISNFGKSS